MQLGSKQYPDLKLDKLACEASRALGKSGQLESWAFPPDCCLQIPDLGQWGGGWGGARSGGGVPKTQWCVCCQPWTEDLNSVSIARSWNWAPGS